MQGPSNWVFTVNEKISNETILSQTNYYMRSGNSVVGSLLINKRKIQNDYMYNLKIYIGNINTIIGIIFNYYDLENFEQLMLVVSSKNPEIVFQRIRSKKEVEKIVKPICKNQNDIQKMHENENLCVSLSLNQWNEILIISFDGKLTIAIGDQIYFNFENHEKTSKNDFLSVGLNYLAGNDIGVKDIEFSQITLPQKVENTVFGSAKRKFYEMKKKNQQNPLQFERFNFKEKIRNKNRNLSIENIKLECLKFQGSEESCTQAMIAYDELINQRKFEEIEEGEISRVIYKKCLNFEGNSPLGCSFAYKTALEVRDYLFLLLVINFNFQIFKNSKEINES